MSYDDHVLVRGTSDVPDGQHYAILFFKTIYMPAQGHGYDAYSEGATDYVIYKTREAWEQAIKGEQVYGGRAFIPIVGTKPKVETKVSIDIQVPK